MKYIYVLLFSLFIGHVTKAQSSFFKQPSFTVGFFNHSIGIPFKDISKLPFNIGATVGVEFNYENSPIAKNVQRFEIGWYNHKHLHKAVWVKSDYIRRFTHKSGFHGELRGGLGYIREFNSSQGFALNSNGIYEPIKDLGTSGYLISVGVGTGYQFEVSDKVMLSPYVRYEGMIQTPYAKIVPFLPHSMMHVGTRVQLLK